MKPNIIWSFQALAMFYRLPWRTAEIVDAAVLRFAETGEGHFEWSAPYYRLRAGPCQVALTVDRKARTLTVLFLYSVRL